MISVSNSLFIIPLYFQRSTLTHTTFNSCSSSSSSEYARESESQMEGSNENLPPLLHIIHSSTVQNYHSNNHLQNLGGGGSRIVKEMARRQRPPLSNINQNITIDKGKPCVLNEVDLSRKRSAQPQTTVHHYAEETKNENLQSYQLVDCGSEYEDTAENAVPVFVKHTEAMLDEIDRIVEEVEMEDAEEPVMDIDTCDRNDPLAVVDYIEDIHRFYKKTEDSIRVSPNYMTSQHDINDKMRAILIDWLIEVHYKFELLEETLFLTVNLIDRFLERRAVIRKKLQLVGVTAMLLACKYEEVLVPTVEDFILITDKAYTRTEVLNMEKLMVNILQFNLSLPTPYVFMRRFLKAAQSDKKLELLSFFLIELCLVECKMLKFSPSLLAAAAIYTAQCSLYQFKQWTKTSEWYTDYSEEQLLECSRLMVTFHRNAGSGKLTGVYRKYSTWKYGYTAKLEPALFLLDSN